MLRKNKFRHVETVIFFFFASFCIHFCMHGRFVQANHTEESNENEDQFKDAYYRKSDDKSSYVHQAYEDGVELKTFYISHKVNQSKPPILNFSFCFSSVFAIRTDKAYKVQLKNKRIQSIRCVSEESIKYPDSTIYYCKR